MTRPATPLIDVHAHFVTDDYVAAAIASGRRHPDGMPGWPSWDAEQNLTLMDTWGVGAAVLRYALGLGRPAPMMEFIFDTARTVSDLLLRGVFTRYPDIEWIFTHGGGALPLLADRLELFRSAFAGAAGSAFGSGDAPAVQAQVRRLWFDMAGTPFPNQVPALVKAFGSDRVLYGSDYCWTPAPGVTAQVASVDAASAGGTVDGTGGTDWRALTSRNAARLLPRLAGL